MSWKNVMARGYNLDYILDTFICVVLLLNLDNRPWKRLSKNKEAGVMVFCKGNLKNTSRLVTIQLSPECWYLAIGGRVKRESTLF